MGPGLVVRGGVGGALAGSCLLHVCSDGGEGTGEVVEGPGEYGARVTDGEGNELHPSPYLLRAAMKGEYFSVFFSILMSQPKSL